MWRLRRHILLGAFATLGLLPSVCHGQASFQDCGIFTCEEVLPGGSCEEVLNLNQFTGTCCSLQESTNNSTSGEDICTLEVSNGTCIVTSRFSIVCTENETTLDLQCVSGPQTTYTSNNTATCPASDYNATDQLPFKSGYAAGLVMTLEGISSMNNESIAEWINVTTDFIKSYFGNDISYNVNDLIVDTTITNFEATTDSIAMVYLQFYSFRYVDSSTTMYGDLPIQTGEFIATAPFATASSRASYLQLLQAEGGILMNVTNTSEVFVRDILTEAPSSVGSGVGSFTPSPSSESSSGGTVLTQAPSPMANNSSTSAGRSSMDLAWVVMMSAVIVALSMVLMI